MVTGRSSSARLFLQRVGNRTASQERNHEAQGVEAEANEVEHVFVRGHLAEGLDLVHHLLDTVVFRGFEHDLLLAGCGGPLGFADHTEVAAADLLADLQLLLRDDIDKPLQQAELDACGTM